MFHDLLVVLLLLGLVNSLLFYQDTVYCVSKKSFYLKRKRTAIIMIHNSYNSGMDPCAVHLVYGGCIDELFTVGCSEDCGGRACCTHG